VAGGILTLYIFDVLTIAPEHLGDVRIMFALLMLSLALKLALSPLILGLDIRQKHLVANMISTGGQFLKIGAIFILLTTVSVKVLWVIVATVAADVIVQLTMLTLSLRLVPALRFRRRSVNWPVARELLSFGGWSTITALALSIRSSADAIILNNLGTPLGVTCYYLGALPLQHINGASSAALFPLNPALIAMHTSGQTERLGRVFLKGGRWALWFTLFVSVPLMLYGREVITLYVGKEFELAGAVMFLVLLAFPVEQGIRMLFPLAEATAAIRRLSLSLLAISIFNLSLTIYFVGVLKMGALGSGLGTALSVVLLYPLLLWPLAFRIAKIDFRTWLRKTLWPGLLPGMASAIVLLALKGVVSLDSWFNVFCCISVGSLAYLAALWFRGLQEEEHHELQKFYASVRAWRAAA